MGNEIAIQNAIVSPDGIDTLIESAVVMVSLSSQRVYRQTFARWKDWCHDQQYSPFDFQYIRLFLESQSVTRATRRRQLSAMRLLVEAASILDIRFEPIYKLVKRMKMPKTNLSTNERDRHALNPSQVNLVFEVWTQETNREIRNQAIIGLLFLCGVRRAEAAVLEWRDIDLAEGVIFIRDGKGEKERDVSIAGEFAIKAFKRWRKVSGGDRRYVFCQVNRGDNLGADAPITPDAIYKVVGETRKLSGVKFAPHDARRTFITEALATNAPIADVQAQAGHSNESTTLHYAQPVAARERRGRFRLRYGS